MPLSPHPPGVGAAMASVPMRAIRASEKRMLVGKTCFSERRECKVSECSIQTVL